MPITTRQLITSLTLLCSSVYSYAATPTDFSGDGVSDVLVRHGSGGNWYLYELDNMQVTGKGSVGMTFNLDYEVAGIGDLDGDGSADVVLRHKTDGNWYVYYLNNRTVKDKGSIGLSRDLDYEVAGIGDMDGDGKADILLRHKSTGNWLQYLMNGKVIKQQQGLNLTRSLDFAVADTGDYNGDGRDDVLLRHRSGGNWYLYMLDGAQVIGKGSVGMTADLQFEPVVKGDMDGDGKRDVVFRHKTQGNWYAYHLNGVAVKDKGALPLTWNLAFEVAATGDYNGDGKSDVLMRSTSGGNWWYYLMDNRSVTGRGSPSLTWDHSFSVQADPRGSAGRGALVDENVFLQYLTAGGEGVWRVKADDYYHSSWYYPIIPGLEIEGYTDSSVIALTSFEYLEGDQFLFEGCNGQGPEQTSIEEESLENYGEVCQAADSGELSIYHFQISPTHFKAELWCGNTLFSLMEIEKIKDTEGFDYGSLTVNNLSAGPLNTSDNVCGTIAEHHTVVNYPQPNSFNQPNIDQEFYLLFIGAPYQNEHLFISLTFGRKNLQPGIYNVVAVQSGLLPSSVHIGMESILFGGTTEEPGRIIAQSGTVEVTHISELAVSGKITATMSNGDEITSEFSVDLQ